MIRVLFYFVLFSTQVISPPHCYKIYTNPPQYVQLRFPKKYLSIIPKALTVEVRNLVSLQLQAPQISHQIIPLILSNQTCSGALKVKIFANANALSIHLRNGIDGNYLDTALLSRSHSEAVFDNFEISLSLTQITFKIINDTDSTRTDYIQISSSNTLTWKTTSRCPKRFPAIVYVCFVDEIPFLGVFIPVILADNSSWLIVNSLYAIQMQALRASSGNLSVVASRSYLASLCDKKFIERKDYESNPIVILPDENVSLEITLQSYRGKLKVSLDPSFQRDQSKIYKQSGQAKIFGFNVASKKNIIHWDSGPGNHFYIGGYSVECFYAIKKGKLYVGIRRKFNTGPKQLKYFKEVPLNSKDKVKRFKNFFSNEEELVVPFVGESCPDYLLSTA